MSLQAIVAYLTQKKEVINGKKAFQKYMYFIDAVGIPTPLNFRIHHFGPYSSHLNYETDNLELNGALVIKENDRGNGYIIYPGKNTESIISKNEEFIKKYAQKIDYVLNSLPKEPLILELWSTTHFVTKSLNDFYGGETKEKVIQEVKSIKGEKFTEQQIAEAYDKLKELKLLN